MSNLQDRIILKDSQQHKDCQDENITKGEGSFFDRQQLIAWWDQEKLAQARILVVGAGALGNEVLKNLALLGVGHILVADFDTIEDSNLSRTVLFRTSDAVNGAKKAEVAARRAKSLNPNPHAIVKPIHGNIVWELGMGVYRHVDLVIGCLDNLEARLHVNLNCWHTRTPWIDGGMWELSGNVAVYDGASDKACYECGMTPYHYRQAKVRYSCTNETVKTKIKEGHEPTTQTTSAIIAAIQSQEAVKILHDIPSFPGRRLIFNGAPHFYYESDYAPMITTELTVNSDCLCHGEDRVDNLLELEDASAHLTTVRELFEMVNDATGWESSSLELGRVFAIEATCPQCLQITKLNRPLFEVRDIDVVCRDCEVRCPTCGAISIGAPDCPNCGQTDISVPNIYTVHRLDPYAPELHSYLEYTLANLGIPPLHIMRVCNASGESVYVELSDDAKQFWDII